MNDEVLYVEVDSEGVADVAGMLKPGTYALVPQGEGSFIIEPLPDPKPGVVGTASVHGLTVHGFCHRAYPSTKTYSFTSDVGVTYNWSDVVRFEPDFSVTPWAVESVLSASAQNAHLILPEDWVRAAALNILKLLRKEVQG